VFYAHAASMILISNNFFFISANLIGMLAAYNIEYYTRRDFYLNQELDRQKTAVEDVNKNLEEIVDERTKDLIQSKNKAEKSDRLKTAFMQNISHEIRTPLNSILGFNQLMADPDLTSDEREEYLTIVKSSSNRLINTVTDFMDVSLIASGNQEVQKKQFSPGDMLDLIYKRFIQPCKAKKLTLSIQTPPMADKLRIHSDHELLFKTVSHLVDNAIKFTKQGAVSFGFEIKGNELEFFVKDTGVGINRDLQATIFDTFTQENVSDTRGHEGSGLGLSIAKGFVELLGGRIWIESSKGEGSAFFFTLPNDMTAD
jgi:signal transduction histidine kinase